MASENFAYITPYMIKWARERVGMSEHQLAERMGVTPERVAAWEEGELPQLAVAEDLASNLRVPFGYLFLRKPPVRDIRIPDLRTTRGNVPDHLSPEFVVHLSNVLLKQEWFREYAREKGGKRLPYVGRFTINANPDIVAEDITQTLNLQEDLRYQCGSWTEFLRRSTDSAEAVGILVMRSGIAGNNTRLKLSVDEFRGFAISDDLAPLVFINSRDSVAAQIFTLAHELTHIWIGSSGISNPDFKKRSDQQSNSIERFCNKVAAQILVPKASFRKLWKPSVGIHENVYRLAHHFRVSSLVILRQAFELGKLSPPDYWRRFQEETEEALRRADRAKAKPGGNIYRTLPVRNSKKLTGTVIEALQGHRIALREAAALFGVKVPTLKSVIEHLA